MLYQPAERLTYGTGPRTGHDRANWPCSNPLDPVAKQARKNLTTDKKGDEHRCTPMLRARWFDLWVRAEPARQLWRYARSLAHRRTLTPTGGKIDIRHRTL